MNSLKWKRFIGQCMPKALLPRKLILIYHAIGDSPWALKKNIFEMQMQWLSDHAHIIPLDAIFTENKSDRIQVAITFDDGYACLYHDVLPILNKINSVATVYLNTGWIAEIADERKQSQMKLGHYPDEQFLTWEEVISLEKAGWEIGSHGVEHANLTIAEHAVVQHELLQSKKAIEYRLQKPCRHFAYTFGYHHAALQNEVKKAGYDYAVAAHHAVYRKSDHSMMIPRMNIQNDYTMNDFINIILGKWDFLNYIHRVKRVIA